jgi:hypothetical protein
MIVWGGTDVNSNVINTGGTYDPGTDSWLPTNTADAPSARYLHTAIWTGNEMIVWVAPTEGTYSVTARDTVQAQIAGRQPALSTRLMADRITRQCGLAAK